MILPEPNDTFHWVQVEGHWALRCRALEGLAPHLFTTRRWPLGASVAGDLTHAWNDIARAMKVAVERVARVRQVHGADVAVWPKDGQAPPEPPEADIIISNDPAVALAVVAADCVPLLVADRRTGAVAAAHAGWRGMAAGVPRVSVEALGRECGSRPADLVAAAGPSVGACCYEVGADVRRHFEEAGFLAADLARWFHARPRSTAANPSMPGLPTPRADHWYFDGWAAVRDQLEATGVPRDQIFVAELCTASHPALLCSYRHDRSAAGRMAGAIRKS